MDVMTSKMMRSDGVTAVLAAGHGGAVTATAAVAATGASGGWRVFWIAYAVCGLVAELIALVRHQHGDTASETVWWLRGPVNGWRAFAIIAACVWVTLHFGFGLFS